jgi:hypothetical protein
MANYVKRRYMRTGSGIKKRRQAATPEAKDKVMTGMMKKTPPPGATSAKDIGSGYPSIPSLAEARDALSGA